MVPPHNKDGGMNQNVIYIGLDIDDNPNLSQFTNSNSVPTLDQDERGPLSQTFVSIAVTRDMRIEHRASLLPQGEGQDEGIIKPKR
jgi:hypothetical protein